MEFRWVALITLWTVLSGPIFCQTRSVPATGGERSLTAHPAKTTSSPRR